MKRMFKRIFMVCVVLGAIGTGIVITYLHQPLFGSLPSDEQMARIQRSPNFANGKFHNQIDTPINTTEQSELSMWMETIFGEKGHPRPERALPAVKTDLKSLNAQEDLVVWLGHSSYFVQLSGKRILIDPAFSNNAAPVPFANVAFEGTSIYTADDMPEVDLLLISHDHYDHLDYPSIKALQAKVHKVVVGLGVGAHLESWGYDPAIVQEADWYDAFDVAPDIRIHVLPARHFSGRTFDRDTSLWVSYALITPQRRLYFSGDTGYAPHFSEIGQQLGPFDWVALDMGQYDPRWANVHMNPEQASLAAQELRAKVLMPSHVGRFSLSPHDWDDPFKRIVAASQGRNYSLWTPEIGRPAYLDGRPQSFISWWEGDAPNTHPLSTADAKVKQ
jgi:L-ascorbate metabolism protein UlaG (beta-lactamase superfamily)